MLVNHSYQKLNVMLVDSGADGARMENALKEERFNYIKFPYGPLFISLVKETRPDIIILDLDFPTDQLLSELRLLCQELPLPTLMFIRDDNVETINKAIQAEVSVLIVKGMEVHRLGSVIALALARFKQHQALKTALEKARLQLEDRKQIDRAKAILIKAQNFSEDQAYHTLRKLAMDRNITLGEMARNVIAMAELLK